MDLNFLSSVKAKRVCGTTCVCSPIVCASTSATTAVIKITSGAASGCVLTSGADGTASWSTPNVGTVNAANNGLTKTGSYISLGGTLTGNTTIYHNNKDFVIKTNAGDCGQHFCIDIGNNFAEIGMYHPTGDQCLGYFQVGYNYLIAGLADIEDTPNRYACYTSYNLAGLIWNGMCVRSGTTNTQIIQRPNTIMISGTTGFPGVQYCTSYSGSYTDRSLVDRGYVSGTYAPIANPTFTGTVTAPVIKLTTGAASGCVLTSAADGTASWATPSGGGLAWSGTTANGVGTYLSATKICAQSCLTFNGSTLGINNPNVSSYHLVISAGTNCQGIIVYGDNDRAADISYGMFVSNRGTGAAAYVGGTFDAYSASAEAEGKSFGVLGCAGNRTNNNNFGVMGILCGTNTGAGIYGSVGNYATTPTGCWAGVFCGPVYVCSSLCTTTFVEATTYVSAGSYLCSITYADVGTCAVIGTTATIGTNIILTTGGARTMAFGTASTGIGSALTICGNSGRDCVSATACAGGTFTIVAGCGGAESGGGTGVNGGAGGATTICGGTGGCTAGTPGIGGAGGALVLRGGTGGAGTTQGTGGAVCIVAGGGGTDGTVYIYNDTLIALCAVPATCVALNYNNSLRFATTNAGGTLTGCLCATTCGVSPDWVATSDCRLKTDIQPISSALSMVVQLCGVCYHLCDDEKNEGHIGLVAQDVLDILPEVVSHTKVDENDAIYEKYGITDEVLGLKYDKLTAVLIEAVKEQQAHINKLELEVCDLKGNLNLLRRH
jgi:hypothetical protein